MPGPLSLVYVRQLLPVNVSFVRQGHGWGRVLVQNCRHLFFQLGKFARECNFQHFVHLLHPVKLHGRFDELGKIREVTLVFHGQHGFKNAGTMSRQQLFFQAADRQYLAAKSDLARHRDVAANGHPRKRRRQRRSHRDAGRWSILGDGSFGNVDVDVDVAVEVLGQAKVM